MNLLFGAVGFVGDFSSELLLDPEELLLESEELLLLEEDDELLLLESTRQKICSIKFDWIFSKLAYLSQCLFRLQTMRRCWQTACCGE